MHSSRGKLLALLRGLLIRGVYYIPAAALRNGVLLDFGSGDGSYLQSLRGRVGRLIGFEFSSQQAERLAAGLGCPVYSSLSEAADDLAGQVDAVTAHFVLEHLSDLHAAFRFWGRVLKPGGTLHLAVPDIRSWEARLFRKKWHGLDPPRHISFPGGKSLLLLMEQHGFTLARKGRAIFPNTLAASISNALFGRYHHALFLSLIPLGFMIASLLPQGTTVYEIRKSP
jgi:SAM-dependent methyltransferase